MPLNGLNPAFAGTKSRNIRLATSIASRENALRFFASPNGGDGPWTKFSIPSIKSVILTALASAIRVVIRSGSHLKMLRVYAGRFVAGMKENFSFRNSSDKKLIRETVGAHGFFSWKKKNSVPIFVLVALPNPACLGFLNAAFKGFSLRDSLMPLMQAFSPSLLVVIPAKVTRYCWFAASGALGFLSGLVSHALIVCHHHRGGNFAS